MLPLAADLSRAGTLASSDRLQVERAADAVMSPLTAISDADGTSLLHGDLWSGNVLFDASGAPVLIDPAVYVGHREVDLAMTRLFGGFPEAFYEAYAEAWPLIEGWEDRLAIYQLYPLLVHARLFGGSYVSAVVRTARTILDRFGG